ncbi:hypothetical protein IEQ34_002656 [Dendrobium chrysotoxum]|uniref:Pentatricopeptide repeat-containing protein n=1 Tax=Dendrobium chrysotoxum TaxID=161865 RepID=A0AAV7HHU3_DENCH|nr:hypothetical protein IEQ34_002656 [Dendrobium chrysotoxum]
MLRRGPTFQPKHCFAFNYLFLYTESSLSSTIRSKLTPHKFTIPALLKLSIALGAPLLHGEHLHAITLKSGLIHDLLVSTGLVELYFRNGQLKPPHHLFDEIPERDVVLFTAMISSYAQNGVGNQALEFFSKMIEEGKKPDKMTFSIVLSASSELK